MQKLDLIQNRWKFLGILTIITISTIVSLFIFPRTMFLEEYSYKYRLQLHSKELPDKKIILVLIDDNSVSKNGSESFKRSKYAKVIAAILEGKPRVIGIDVFFDRIKKLEDDLKLIEVLDKADADIVLAVYPREVDNLIINKIKPIVPYRSYSFKKISVGNAAIFRQWDVVGIAEATALPFIDRDGQEFIPFPIIITAKYQGSVYKQNLLPSGVAVLTLNEISIPQHMLINYVGGVNTFDTISFDKVADIDKSIFNDKIVLVGKSNKSSKDNHLTPISDKTPGIIIHANIINMVLSKTFISPLQLEYYIFINLLISLVIVIITMRANRTVSLSMCIGMLILWKIVIDFLFVRYHIYLMFTPVFYCVPLSYFGAIVVAKVAKSKRDGEFT